MKKLSAVVIAYNEESKIGTTLRSLVAVCDEIVVVDSMSDDGTAGVARQYSARVIQRSWPGYVAQKQFALEQARFDWVLSLDADEKLSRDLTREVSRWKERDGEDLFGYRIPRLTYFMGRWIRHTIWSPDYQLRLFRKDRSRWTGGRVHEGVVVDGKVGTFQSPICHFTYADSDEYLQQLRRFARLAAEDAYDDGRRFSALRLFLSPPAVFLKSYLFKRGFLDGIPGFVVSGLAAISTFFKIWKLRELESRDERERWQDIEI